MYRGFGSRRAITGPHRVLCGRVHPYAVPIRIVPPVIARIAVLLAVVEAGSLLGAAASAQAPVPPHTPGAPLPRYQIAPGVMLQAVFTPQGTPWLTANPTVGDANPQFLICPPASPGTCTPVAANAPRSVNPGPEPAGTVFEAQAEEDGQTYTASATWRGQVKAVTLPGLRAPARVGAVARPIAGTWTGGWGDEHDQLNVEACRTRSAQHCVSISGGQLWCPGGFRPLIGSWFTGWYLFTFDARIPADSVCAGVGLLTAAGAPVWKVDAIVSRSAPVGPIAGPPPPRVAFLRHALRRGRRVLVASVRCSGRCPVFIDVFGSAGGGIARLTIKGSQLVGVVNHGIDPGRLHVTLAVAGGPLLQGRSTLSRAG
jgi:hypothetical protein